MLAAYVDICLTIYNLWDDMSEIYKNLYNSVGYIKNNDICLKIDILSTSRT